MDITWVDDTHCLLIFPNRALGNLDCGAVSDDCFFAAKQASREPIAFMKVRPFSLASQKAKTKAELNGCMTFFRLLATFVIFFKKII